MKTFKRKFNIQPRYLKSTKLWQSFIEQDLQTNSLKNLMQLTERAKGALESFEIKKYENTNESYAIVLTDGYNAALAIHKFANDDFVVSLDYYQGYGFTSDEKDAMTEIVKRAPIHMISYLENHYENMLKRNKV